MAVGGTPVAVGGTVVIVGGTDVAVGTVVEVGGGGTESTVVDQIEKSRAYQSPTTLLVALIRTLVVPAGMLWK